MACCTEGLGARAPRVFSHDMPGRGARLTIYPEFRDENVHVSVTFLDKYPGTSHAPSATSAEKSLRSDHESSNHMGQLSELYSGCNDCGRPRPESKPFARANARSTGPRSRPGARSAGSRYSTI